MKKKPDGLLIALMEKAKKDKKDDEMDEGKKTAAEELISAVKKENPEEVVSAFQSLYEMCD